MTPMLALLIEWPYDRRPMAAAAAMAPPYERFWPGRGAGPRPGEWPTLGCCPHTGWALIVVRPGASLAQPLGDALPLQVALELVFEETPARLKRSPSMPHWRKELVEVAGLLGNRGPMGR